MLSVTVFGEFLLLGKKMVKANVVEINKISEVFYNIELKRFTHGDDRAKRVFYEHVSEFIRTNSTSHFSLRYSVVVKYASNNREKVNFHIECFNCESVVVTEVTWRTKCVETTKSKAFYLFFYDEINELFSKSNGINPFGCIPPPYINFGDFELRRIERKSTREVEHDSYSVTQRGQEVTLHLGRDGSISFIPGDERLIKKITDRHEKEKLTRNARSGSVTEIDLAMSTTELYLAGDIKEMPNRINVKLVKTYLYS